MLNALSNSTAGTFSSSTSKEWPSSFTRGQICTSNLWRVGWKNCNPTGKWWFKVWTWTDTSTASPTRNSRWTGTTSPQRRNNKWIQCYMTLYKQLQWIIRGRSQCRRPKHTVLANSMPQNRSAQECVINAKTVALSWSPLRNKTVTTAGIQALALKLGVKAYVISEDKKNKFYGYFESHSLLQTKTMPNGRANSIPGIATSSTSLVLPLRLRKKPTCSWTAMTGGCARWNGTDTFPTG